MYSRNLMKDNNNDYDNDNHIKIMEVCLKGLKWGSCWDDKKGFLRPSRELKFYMVQLTSHRDKKKRRKKASCKSLCFILNCVPTTTNQWCNYWATNVLVVDGCKLFANTHHGQQYPDNKACISQWNCQEVWAGTRISHGDNHHFPFSIQELSTCYKYSLIYF